MLNMMDDFDDDDVPGEIARDDQGYLVHLVPAASVDMKGYWCVVCMRFVPRENDGVLIHDDIEHPTTMTYDEDGLMQ